MSRINARLDPRAPRRRSRARRCCRGRARSRARPRRAATAPSACDVRTVPRGRTLRGGRSLDDAREPVVRVVEHPLAVGELLQPNALAAGERSDRRHDDHELLPADRLERAFPRSHRAAGRSRSRRRPARRRPRAASGAGTRAGGSRRSGSARARRRCGEGERRPPSRARSRSRALRPRARASTAQRGVRGRRRARAARASGSSARPAGVSATPRGNRSNTGPLDLRLERPDVLRERRLGDADAACRPRERPLVDDRDEALERRKFIGRSYRIDGWSEHLTYRTKVKKLDLVRVTGINHVSISARDLEESTRFYEEVFGMERIATPIFATPRPVAPRRRPAAPPLPRRSGAAPPRATTSG